MCLVELDEWARVSAQVATAPTVAAGARILCRALALTLGRPIALLSRDAEGWHFEAEGFPNGHIEPTLTLPSLLEPLADPDGLRDSTGQAWTGVAVGELSGRQWMLMLPGAADHWSNLSGLEQFIQNVSGSLECMAERDEEAYVSRFNRRLYSFSRRLARDSDSQRAHQLVSARSPHRSARGPVPCPSIFQPRTPSPFPPPSATPARSSSTFASRRARASSAGCSCPGVRSSVDRRGTANVRVGCGIAPNRTWCCQSSPAIAVSRS